MIIIFNIYYLFSLSIQSQVNVLKKQPEFLTEAVAQPHLEKFFAFSTFSMLSRKPHIAKDMKHSSRLENDKNASHFPSREVVQQSLRIYSKIKHKKESELRTIFLSSTMNALDLLKEGYIPHTKDLIYILKHYDNLENSRLIIFFLNQYFKKLDPLLKERIKDSTFIDICTKETILRSYHQLQQFWGIEKLIKNIIKKFQEKKITEKKLFELYSSLRIQNPQFSLDEYQTKEVLQLEEKYQTQIKSILKNLKENINSDENSSEKLIRIIQQKLLPSYINDFKVYIKSKKKILENSFFIIKWKEVILDFLGIENKTQNSFIFYIKETNNDEILELFFLRQITEILNKETLCLYYEDIIENMRERNDSLRFFEEFYPLFLDEKSVLIHSCFFSYIWTFLNPQKALIDIQKGLLKISFHLLLKENIHLKKKDITIILEQLLLKKNEPESDSIYAQFPQQRFLYFQILSPCNTLKLHNIWLQKNEKEDIQQAFIYLSEHLSWNIPYNKDEEDCVLEEVMETWNKKLASEECQLFLQFLKSYLSYRIWGKERLLTLLKLAQKKHQQNSKIITQIKNYLTEYQHRNPQTESLICQVEEYWPFGAGKNLYEGTPEESNSLSPNYTWDIKQIKNIFEQFYTENEKRFQQKEQWESFIEGFKNQVHKEHYETLLQMFMIYISHTKKVQWLSSPPFTANIYNFETHEWNIQNLAQLLIQKDAKESLFFYSIHKERKIKFSDHTALPYISFLPEPELISLIKYFIENYTESFKNKKTLSCYERDIPYPLLTLVFFALRLVNPPQKLAQEITTKMDNLQPKEEEKLIELISTLKEEKGIKEVNLFNRSIEIIFTNEERLILKFKKEDEENHDFLALLLWEKFEKTLKNNPIDPYPYPYPTLYGYYNVNIEKLILAFPELKSQLQIVQKVTQSTAPTLVQAFSFKKNYFDYFDKVEENLFEKTEINEPQGNSNPDKVVKKTGYFIGQSAKFGIFYPGIISLFHSTNSEDPTLNRPFISCPSFAIWGHSFLLRGTIDKNNTDLRYPNVSKETYLRDLDNNTINESQELNRIKQGLCLTNENLGNLTVSCEELKKSIKIQCLIEAEMALGIEFYPAFIAGFLEADTKKQDLIFQTFQKMNQSIKEGESSFLKKRSQKNQTYKFFHPSFLPSRPHTPITKHSITNRHQENQKRHYQGQLFILIYILIQKGLTPHFDATNGKITFEDPPISKENRPVNPSHFQEKSLSPSQLPTYLPKSKNLTFHQLYA